MKGHQGSESIDGLLRFSRSCTSFAAFRGRKFPLIVDEASRITGLDSGEKEAQNKKITVFA